MSYGVMKSFQDQTWLHHLKWIKSERTAWVGWKHDSTYFGEEWGKKRKLKSFQEEQDTPRSNSILCELGECMAQKPTNPNFQFQLEDSMA